MEGQPAACYAGFSLCGCENVETLSKTSLLHQLGPGQISGTTRQQHCPLLHAVPFTGDPHFTPTLPGRKQAKCVSEFTSLASGRAKGSGPAPSHPHPCMAMTRVGMPKHGRCVSEEGEHTQPAVGMAAAPGCCSLTVKMLQLLKEIQR